MRWRQRKKRERYNERETKSSERENKRETNLDRDLTHFYLCGASVIHIPVIELLL